MSVGVDALTTSQLLNNIKTCSKEKLLSCLSSMDESHLRHLIFSSLKQSKPQIKQLIDKVWNQYTPENTEHTDHIQQFFINNNNNNKDETKSNNNNSLTSLPSSMGAYIISFNTMTDRINSELVSKDFYKFCQIPMAKYHLIIDHQFCKALYFDTIHIEKYFNAQFVEIFYVFKDSKYEKFEDKYYSIISKILTKSPLLHTIKYKLKYKKFKSKLSQTSIGDPYYGYSGHILEWMTLIQNNKNSRPNMFHSIQKLIWTPSMYHVYRYSSWRKEFETFCNFLPNLTSFVLPKCRVYYYSALYDNSDCIWNVFKQCFYNDTLQHIECNMNAIRIRLRGWRAYKHINIKNHPLPHIQSFKNLKSLRLTLPIFRNCEKYYAEFIPLRCSSLEQDVKKFAQCTNLTEVSLEFVQCDIDRFERGENYTMSFSLDYNVIDDLCQKILSFCPNIKKYKCITNNLYNGKEFKHLIGFYDRLECFETDTISMIYDQKKSQARMIGLKKLTLLFYDDLKTVCNDLQLSKFPNLETFKCIFRMNESEKLVNVNANIYDFISYLSKQKYNKKLKYIGIYHAHDIKIKKEYFKLKSCTKDKSLELCKSIILLTNSNSKIKSVELSPVAFKQKELQYLYFWFNQENGCFDANNYFIKSNTIVTDLYFSQ